MSPEITVLRERMADIGERIWNKDYVDGNGGNLTIRVGDNLVLCTPTLISKGFMTADDMCLVDLNGTQLAGTRKRTSEVMTHIGIMKRQPKAKACCHAHPPHATAFAVASVIPPTCMIPEAEVFLGQIGLAPYQTPGSPENADTVGEIGVTHQSVLMENHGVITWGKDIEDAYWKMENTDAYCKTVWMASQLNGGKMKTITGSQAKELIEIRKSLGMDDPRENLKECELCDNSEWRPGVVCGIPESSPSPSGSQPEYDDSAEALVQQITNEIMKSL
jgi:L-fuculose-phosphate aldolase